MSSWRVIQADCIEALRGMDEASVDAIVTDPPYGLEFMGKEWDRLQADVGGRDDLRASLKGERVAGGEFGERIGIAYGAPHKNPRCRKCYKLKHDHDKGRCKCAAPDWDIRKSEYGYAMQWWHQEWAEAARRVLKPGGHLLAFGGTRTYHRLACGLEDAGFEIRDCLAWMYGSGFPKSLDVSKAIDKAAGAEREVVGPSARHAGVSSPNGSNPNLARHGNTGDWLTAPATPEAERWQGWGTALKPAYEPIVLARKPLGGTVAQNVLEHGTGALNIDGTRIGYADGADLATTQAKANRDEDKFRQRPSNFDKYGGSNGLQQDHIGEFGNPSGRWPANVLLDEEAAAMLDEQSGERPSSGGAAFHGPGYEGGWVASNDRHELGYGDRGGASRFFYVPKADREERNRGLGHHIEQSVHPPSGDDRVWDIPGSKSTHRANNHPTVKPVELMQWLCRLITPPGGTVLDPFTGSGSTGIAALREGFSFVGIEREADYVEIARSRIIGDAPLFNVASESATRIRSEGTD